MKAVLLEDYKINPRAIAEAMWGTGGTNAVRTNRKGAYYYSCSAHGGYVVSPNAFTDEEKALVNQYTEPMKIQALVQHRTDGDYVIAVSLSAIQRYVGKNRQFRYTPHLGQVEWVDIEFYAFEEDCDWAIVEKLTEIKTLDKESTCTPEKRIEIVNSTFEKWATPKRKTPDGENS
jgi:hypothetical protein